VSLTAEFIVLPHPTNPQCRYMHWSRDAAAWKLC